MMFVCFFFKKNNNEKKKHNNYDTVTCVLPSFYIFLIIKMILVCVTLRISASIQRIFISIIIGRTQLLLFHLRKRYSFEVVKI